jgi:eukaryotic-like serine/threonine-protein kinase
VLTASASGHATLRYPFLVGRDEKLTLSIELPPAGAVPEGYVYVPPGRFLFGMASDEPMRRSFFDTTPQHEVHTGGYLIGRTELTYADWLPFLESLPSDERDRRLPHSEARVGQSGGLRLERGPEGVRLNLQLQPAGPTLSARVGEPIVYPGRNQRAQQDWLKLPVTGISAEDALAYAAWLDKTGRLPGARLCTEFEWERAARGADGRLYPHGNKLAPADANHEATYNREGRGPDEVGSHPASTSPFGLDDMAGNVFEWTRSSFDDQFTVRGGSFLHDEKTAQTANRNVAPRGLRDTIIGVRLCAPFASPNLR